MWPIFSSIGSNFECFIGNRICGWFLFFGYVKLLTNLQSSKIRKRIFFPSMSLCIHKMLIGFIVLRFVDGRGSDNGNGNANSRLIYSHEPLPTWLVVRYVMEFHIFDYESIHLHWQRGENRIDLTFKNVFFSFSYIFLSSFDWMRMEMSLNFASTQPIAHYRGNLLPVIVF